MKFSVVMPTFNREGYITEGIESILNQTSSDWELLIVDDASSDNTEQIVLQYKDTRIKYIKLPVNKGVAYARNVGYKMSQGEYIAIADSDDINHPERLEKMGLYLDYHKEMDIVVTDIQIINEDNKRGSVMTFRKSNEEVRVWWLFQPMLPSFMMFRKREIQLKNKLYHDESFRAAVDYQWYSNLDIDSKIGVIPEVLYFYRRHQNQISTEGYESQQVYADLIRHNILNTMEVTSTETERELHSCISQGRFEKLSSVEFERCIRWFEKIIKCNEKVKAFNERIVRKVLQEKLISIIECTGLIDEELFDMLQKSQLSINSGQLLRPICKNQVERLLSNDIYIYGCKWTGYSIGRHILGNDMKFIGYIDGNDDIKGKKMFGKKIIGPDNANNIEKSIIIISVLSNAKYTIADNLINAHGVQKNNIIFSSDLLVKD